MKSVTERLSASACRLFKKKVLALLLLLLVAASALSLLLTTANRSSERTEPYFRCDLDHDGDCDSEDQAFFDTILGSCTESESYAVQADIDKDGCITEADRGALFSFPDALPPTLEEPLTGSQPMAAGRKRTPCDLDFSGACDSSDIRIFMKALGTCRGDTGYMIIADADMDGCVTFRDQARLFVADQLK